jgi:ArsR family metal-binding transcriptional regulator
VATLSKKEAAEQEQQQQAKNGYWQNELYSLGIIEPKQKKELNDNKEELENLSDIIKQAMFQDYKVAYSEKGDAHKEEAESTLTVG